MTGHEQPITGPVLSLGQVSVRFGGVQALDGVNIDVPTGIVFGIIGPNGAGKTTLFNCISGLIRPSSGSRIAYRGQDIAGMAVHKVARLGIGRTFQNISLLRERSVRENILMGMHLALPYSPLAAFLPGSRVRSLERDAILAVEQSVDLLRLPRGILDKAAGELSLGQQKKIEVARAIVRRPRLLLLDEPAGGLNDRETADFATALRGLQAELHLSVVLIDHDMNLVMDLCQQVSVLSFGRLIAQGSPAEIQRNPEVVSVYLGTADAA
jgi:branched-chain amino acid transport system ATP-binding protein